MGLIGERSWLDGGVQAVQGTAKRLMSNTDRSPAALSDRTTERWVWAAVSTVAFLLLAGPALRSPDGLAMLRLSAQWMGGDATVADAGFWPKLWPALNLPSVALGHGVEGARLINLLMWGLVSFPLHLLAGHLGGVSAARRAVLLYLLLPLFWPFCAVIDARALITLITTGFVAAAVHAVRTTKGWAWVWALAAIAPLARPEGIILPVMAGLAMWFSGRHLHRCALVGLACFVPHLLARGTGRGVSGHEALFSSFFATWTQSDILALFGPSSVPTSFRAFALAAVESGVVESQPSGFDVLNLTMTVPLGLLASVVVLVSGIGFVGLLMAVRGLVMVLPRRRRWIVAAVFVPWMGVAIAPMARGQADPIMNFLFLFPAVIALIAVGLTPSRRGRLRWPMALAAVLAAEVYLSPLKPEVPYFIESSEAADLARAMLVHQPPPGREIATDFSGRDLVLGAGYEVVQLEPVWLQPVPAHVKAVLISSVGAWGEDGGRALSLLEDPRWQAAWVTADGDIAASEGRTDSTPRGDRGWYALLVERAAPVPVDAAEAL
jgi:hypothetical protein